MHNDIEEINIAASGKIGELITKGCSILAFGCAENSLTALLLPNTDISLSVVKDYSDWEAPFHGKSFDILLFSEAWDEVEDTYALLARAKKYLKADGKLLFTTANKPCFAAHPSKKKASDDAFQIRVSDLGEEEFSAFFEKAGFFLSYLGTIEDALGITERENTIEKAVLSSVRFFGIAQKAEYAAQNKLCTENLLALESSRARYTKVSFFDQEGRALESHILHQFSFDLSMPKGTSAASVIFYGYGHTVIENFGYHSNAKNKWKSDDTLLLKRSTLCITENAAAFYLKVSEADVVVLRGDVADHMTEAEYLLAVKNSRGKLPKPIHALIRLIKKPFRRIPFLIMFKKGIFYLFKYGPRMTFKKMRDRFKAKRVSRKKLYTKEQLLKQSKHVFPEKHVFSILVPLYNTPERFLEEMIDSVAAQTYPHWELCLADGSDAKHSAVGEYCKERSANDPRIKYKKLEKNLGISENTNACIEMATGDFIALFDHDDILHPAALYNFMVAICEKGADFVYTDEATFESPKLKKIISIHHKPDFAPDNLRANNYICHFSAFARTVLEKAGNFRKAFDGSQDHDMILRLTEAASCIVHIPKILYYWRSHPLSVAMDINSKTYAIDAGRSAVKESVRRAGMNATVESSRAFPTIYRIFYEIPQKEKVSIIIANQDKPLEIKRCVDSILALTSYPSYEIIIADNASSNAATLAYYEKIKRENGVTILSQESDSNLSRLSNAAAKAATGKYVLFLASTAKVITPAWIEEMMMYAQRDDVGAVGGMLYYPDGTVRHAGMILGLGEERIAGYPFRECKKQEIGYMGRLCYSQNMSAVSSACMLISKELFLAMGGFDEGFAANYADVDLCLKIRASGKNIAWTPHAELYQFSVKNDLYSQKPTDADITLFKEKWADTLNKGDPYYNPNFSLDRNDFCII